MLQLQGNAAVVMLVAKGGLSDIPEIIHRVQAGIAVMAGLTQVSHVREGDAIRITAELFDKLSHAGLLARPAQDMLSYFCLMDCYNDTVARQKGRSPESPAHMLLGSFISAIRGMRIRSDAGEELVDWKTLLPENFEKQARALYKASQPVPQSLALA